MSSSRSTLCSAVLIWRKWLGSRDDAAWNLQQLPLRRHFELDPAVRSPVVRGQGVEDSALLG